MSKHSSSENSNGDAVAAGPQAKRPRMVEFEPVRICSISGVKDIDNKVLKAQHYKLCERFRHKEKLRQILEKRVEELEGRQAKDDEVSCIINRYWNRLDEDVQLLLQRFDAEATLDVEDRALGDENVKHFLTVLSNWGVEEVDEKLSERVEFTRRALSKLVQVFDKVVERNTRLCSLISGEKDPFNPSRLSSPDDSEHNKSPEVPESPKKELIEAELKNHVINVLNENVKLQRLTTKLQAENHRLTLESAGKDDEINIMENRVESYSNKCEDAQYELSKTLSKYEKLDYRLAEYVRKEQTLQVQAPVEIEKQQNGMEDMASIGKAQLEDLQQQLDIQTELANNRLQELQDMTEKNKTLASELETCEMKLKYLPSDQVKELPEYVCLQSNYSCLLVDCRALRHEAEELKQQMNSLKQTHAKQIEKMKLEATGAHERMNDTLLDMDNQLNTVSKEYDTLCMEFEQNHAANEQAGPINEQVLALMKTFSTQNDQLKLDVRRYKRKCEEINATLIKCQKELEAERKINNDNYLIIKLEDEPPEITSPDPHNAGHMPDVADVKCLRGGSNGGDPCSNHPECAPSGSQSADTSMDLKPLKKELSTSEEFNFALQTGSAIERRLKTEVEKLKEKLREVTKAERKEKMKYYSDEARRKIRSLEEQCEKLRKELTNAKQEEEGLMNEMEATGQAFEDMQEQNQKLVQQLREKDEANLNLMGERIRNNQAQKKVKEEKELLDRLLVALNDQMDAKTLLCHKLEEKEKALMENRATLEHELKLKDHTIELLRRKATEATQSANDMKLRLDKLTTQFNDVQQRLKKKASSFEAMSMNIKRMEEEHSRMKRQIERAKRMEKYDNFDKVLEEENRLLKEVLTCPSCKVNRKDAIILKCSHTFCMACLKRRYECRSRKCPTCSQAFSQQDFRRIYLE
ncbi:zinc finger, c3HC4 type (RING finger) domain-containing protein [Ditylenchus destructor]|uniref:E3 ubiquitin protein ligase n=1 Tax=Ditylenchus destructor TaxID=166010 RepID=A0AAD4MSH2_9BILA|nr:zinc finger, c3HC4 type (RING finger) domain-containing protein [Ditylenchus destructor]